ncbi:hypothetical protein [Mycolicibacterium baixiangningiae]|uniref:hypothetical protein n=1 Tax=Mycolicibacterium baixiangningiae TaxID=2761578 RepID=UPI001E57943E|nr:hypothetical protein [Mycolicibacterium baixiangningiae]
MVIALSEWALRDDPLPAGPACELAPGVESETVESVESVESAHATPGAGAAANPAQSATAATPYRNDLSLRGLFARLTCITAMTPLRHRHQR